MRSCKRELLSQARERARAKRSREGGFLLTLELLLLLSIFGIVIYFGLQLYEQHVISSIDPMGGPQTVIYDGNSNPVSRAEAYSPNEGPQFIYRPTSNGDLTLPNARTDPKDAALLGARSDGFTTRQRVYFLGANCTGPAYLLDPSADYEPRSRPRSTPRTSPITARSSSACCACPATVARSSPISTRCRATSTRSGRRT